MYSSLVSMVIQLYMHMLRLYTRYARACLLRLYARYARVLAKAVRVLRTPY